MAEFIIPVSDRGSMLTPIENATRVPLPIWAPGDGATNRHHAHYYRIDFENGPHNIMTRAVRFSRLQEVRKGPHRWMHDAFDGALMPRSAQEAFTITVLSCAGYIPAYAVDLTDRDPEVVEMTPRMRNELKRPGVFTIESRQGRRAEIGQFLMYYALWQKFDDEEMSKVEQFLSITPEQMMDDELARQRKLRLGLRLTGKAIEAAVDPINSEYQRARNEDALRPGAPVCAWLAVKEFVKGYEPDYFETLELKLKLDLGVAA